MMLQKVWMKRTTDASPGQHSKLKLMEKKSGKMRSTRGGKQTHIQTSFEVRRLDDTQKVSATEDVDGSA